MKFAIVICYDLYDFSSVLLRNHNISKLRFSICFSQLLIQPILKTDDEVAANL